MGLETLKLSDIVIALIVVGCIASIFGFRLRPAKAHRMETAHAAPPRVSSDVIAREPARSEARALPEPESFRRSANQKLEPLLDALIDRARALHWEARYEAVVEAETTKYRLEVKRPDHPAGQPLPYMTFAAGDDGRVEVVYGGVFPGPADHNGRDPEIGWRTVRWDQVDDVIAAFAHKVFARFD